MFDSLRPHGLQHTRLPCPSPSPGVCSYSCPLSQWYHPTISSSVTLFSSFPQSFLALGSLSMNWLFPSGGQSIGALASVLPVNIQGWFPLGESLGSLYRNVVFGSSALGSGGEEGVLFNRADSWSQICWFRIAGLHIILEMLLGPPPLVSASAGSRRLRSAASITPSGITQPWRWFRIFYHILFFFFF